MNPDGTGEANLTNTPAPAEDDSPSWSPDGTKIAFASNRAHGCTGQRDLFVMNSDGTGVTLVSSDPQGGRTSQPTWSPDGQKIAFYSERDTGGLGSSLYVMNSDGTAVMRLTTQSLVVDGAPAWSPDGSRIAFGRSEIHCWDPSCYDWDAGQSDIYVVNPDGSGQTNLTNTPNDSEGRTSWSPDGSKIAFEIARVIGGNWTGEIYTMNADGTGRTRLTDHTVEAGSDSVAAWSPDGKKIVFQRLFGPDRYVYIMNADGSGQTMIVNNQGFFGGLDWQRIPTSNYPHPQSASQLSVSLGPAFKQCGTGVNPSNAKHAPPLATDSCNPPNPGSVLAAVGLTSQSSAQMTVTPGDTDPTNGNQANVAITASLTDIQSTGGGDYNPNPSGADLTAVTRLRFTDKANGYGGLPATATEYDFKVPIDCSSTSKHSIGSTCSANTTANVLIPGLIQEQRQTVVQAFRVRIDDSGANGIRGDSDDRIFATQGVFVP
jgi:hypothetical protein